MIFIGADGARRHFSALLRRVAGGEEVVITRYGRPVGRLVAAGRADTVPAQQAFEKLIELRKSTTLGGGSWKELRDEGRR